MRGRVFSLSAGIGGIFFAIGVFLSARAYPDVIYFKNGGTIEGAIQKEDDSSIVINLDAGTMTVRKDEVDHVEKSSTDDEERLANARRANEILRGEWAPLGCEEIRIAYLRTKDSKADFEKTRKSCLNVKNELTQKEQRISELLKALDEKSRRLKTIDSDKQTKEYNAVVAEMNSLTSALNTETSARKELSAREKKARETLAEASNKYRGDFQNFKNVLKNRQGAAKNAEVSGDELAFFEEMGNKINEIESNFKKDAVSYTSDNNQLVVDAVINNNALGRFIVDTGASIVVISKEIAGRLGLPEDDIGQEIEIEMADGTTVNARPVILKSVKVGDAEVEDVEAAVLENNVVGGADGLLGMSFLRNFIINVDAPSNKLILEQLL